MHFPKRAGIRAQFLHRSIDKLKEADMEQPVRFTLAQLSPEQRTRVIALLVQMILRQWNKLIEEKQHDVACH
jgi:hypothetical protein